MNLDIRRVDALTRLIIELVQERGEIVHEIEGDRILRFRDRVLGVYGAGAGLAGPYSDVLELLETEALRIHPKTSDVPGRPSGGTRCLYRWRGRLCAFVVGGGFTGETGDTLT